MTQHIVNERLEAEERELERRLRDDDRDAELDEAMGVITDRMEGTR